MNPLPARTSYVHVTAEATHYLVDSAVLGLLDLTLRLPADAGPHPVVLIAYSSSGATYGEALEVARSLPREGFATVLFGRDLSLPYRRFRPVGDWRLALSWAAEHADLRADRTAVWGRGRDAHDVRRLADRRIAGLTAGIAVLPTPRRSHRAEPQPVDPEIPVLTGAGAGDPALQLAFLRTHLGA